MSRLVAKKSICLVALLSAATALAWTAWAAEPAPIAPAANTAPATTSAPATPPLTYDAISDTKYYPKPDLPKIGPAGFIFKDPTFGCPMVRVSDEKTADGASIHTPAGSVQNTWNTDSTMFIATSEGGRAIPFQFDPKTLKVSRIPGLDTIPNVSGDTPFSYREKNVCYGKDIGRAVIVKFDFATRKTTDVCDVAKVTGLPVVNGHLGMFTISANDVLCVCFGGAGQNQDMYCLVYDMKNGAHHVWNTKEGTIDGKAIPGAPSVLMHACAIDAGGRYVSATVAGLWFWDTRKATLFQVPGLNGHRAFGYGEMVYSSQSVYQKLDPEGMKEPKRLLSIHGFSYDTHTSCNNAREGMLVPALLSSEHAQEMGDPKCPCGDEVFAVATDGSQKVWRFCHTRTLVHVPNRDAAGRMANPTSQKNMAEAQPYNFWDTPRGNVSQDGRFFMFNSNWEDTLGKDRGGRFRQDVFIVKLQRDETTAAPASAPAK